tara:strand:+ start:219 stop:488 length:270 start_codon:yes stop_codon:yes gene_type:complete
MPKISTYANAGAPTLTDKLIGTEVGATPTDATKNFTIKQLLTLLEASEWSGLPAYKDNASALLGGLVAGQFFVTSPTSPVIQGLVCRVY